MGRPTKLTPENVRTMLTVLEAGNSRGAAAAAIAADRTTFYDWLKLPDPTYTEPDENGHIPTFADSVERAEHKAELFFADRIRRAATTSEVVEHFDQRGNLIRRTTKYDWKAAQWWLQVRRNFDWKPAPQAIEVSGPDGGPVKTETQGALEFKPDAEWLRKWRDGMNDLPPGVMDDEPTGDEPNEQG